MCLDTGFIGNHFITVCVVGCRIHCFNFVCVWMKDSLAVIFNCVFECRIYWQPFLIVCVFGCRIHCQSFVTVCVWMQDSLAVIFNCLGVWMQDSLTIIFGVAG